MKPAVRPSFPSRFVNPLITAPSSASGTGACAAAVAAAAFGGAGPVMEVVAPGGSQRVELLDDGIYLTGWAEVTGRGVWLSAPWQSAS